MSTTHLKEIWLSILPEIKQVAKEAGTLRAVATGLASDTGYEALKKVKKNLQRLEALGFETEEGLVAQARTALEPVQEWLNVEWTRRAADFCEDLRVHFKDREVELLGTAPHMEAANLGIHIEARKDQATVLYAGEVVKDRIPLTVEAVFREWNNAKTRLARNSMAPDDLLKAMSQAYEEVRKLKDIRPGCRVRLSDLHFQIFINNQTHQVRQDPRKSRVKEYPRYQFAYDLAHFQRDESELSHSGKKVTIFEAVKAATSSRAQSIKLADGRYYSDIQIKDS